MVSIGAFALTIGVLIVIMILFAVCIKLPIYIFFLAVIFILHVVLGSLALAATSKYDGDIYTVVKKVFDDYVNNPQVDDKKTVVDIVQQDFKCCGVEGPQYWNSSGFKQYPTSCYKHNSFDNALYEEGCVSSFEKSIIPKFRAVGGIAIAMTLVEGFGIVYCYILVNSDPEEWQRLLA
ncbi:hypothetical protein Zmor_025825 [Zophobas morio]|uniref:Tetraspanin n=2 Tax=Zophobas morio TaxID=2755281 RepID=A0AA38M4Y6_9CUCU|nr:hypothetical protein Zmor_025825 [Zophobas morio]